MSFTVGVVATGVTFSLSLVWSTVFCDEIAVFSKETMEVWPSSITTFVHIVACHQILRREKGHVFSIFDLHSGFSDLSECNSVA